MIVRRSAGLLQTAVLLVISWVVVFCVLALLMPTGSWSSAERALLPPQSAVTDCEVQIVTSPGETSTLKGTPCDDLIIANDRTRRIESGSGNDVVVGSGSVLEISGGPGEDLIFGNGASVLLGEADDDTLIGSAPTTVEAESADYRAALEPFVASAGRSFVTKAIAGSIAHGKTGEAASLLGCSNYQMIGGSGNDEFEGACGNDQLYGGIGDDRLEGLAGNDLLAGGQGVDYLAGGMGSDWTRGDGTQDSLQEETSPQAGDKDTLSYASGVTPGFAGAGPGVTLFPADEEGRGIYLNLPDSSDPTQAADNGIAGNAGGDDLFNVASDLSQFEVIVGTPFADYIVGSDRDETIFGGGGTDVILGMGGDDTINGGASGDNIDGGTGTNTINGDASFDYCVNGSMTNCNEPPYASPDFVIPGFADLVAVGFQTEVHNNIYDQPFLQLYVRGSTGSDSVSAKYVDPGGSYEWVEFTLASGAFDSVGLENTAGCDYSDAAGDPGASPPVPPTITCSFQDHRILDSIVMAGMGGNDSLTASGWDFPAETNLMMLGGNGNDVLNGGSTTYDQLVDNGGNDVVNGSGRDDGLINGAGLDSLNGGTGDDLLLSTEVCQSADSINGGYSSEDNNASWIQVPAGPSGLGIGVDLAPGRFGEYTPGVGTTCDGSAGSSKRGFISNVQNLEGSSRVDKFAGDAFDNNLLGWRGADILSGNNGADVLMGYSPGFATAPYADPDSFYGGNGSDAMRSVDGRPENLINCGAGFDYGKRDPGDHGQVNQANCESIDPYP